MTGPIYIFAGGGSGGHLYPALAVADELLRLRPEAKVVFAWPGLGRLMIDAIGLRDITIVQAGVFWFAITFMLINLAVDVLYTFLDPRISLEY